MKCRICQDEWSDADGGIEAILDHLRVMHPDRWEPPQRWPDGGLVDHRRHVGAG